MRNWLKWARRDRRLAWIMIIDLLLAIFVIGGLLALAWPAPPTKPTPNTVTRVSPTIAPRLALPTIDPTLLVGLPNQGYNDAPPPPPDLLGKVTVVPGNSGLPLPSVTP